MTSKYSGSWLNWNTVGTEFSIPSSGANVVDIEAKSTSPGYILGQFKYCKYCGGWFSAFGYDADTCISCAQVPEGFWEFYNKVCERS